MPSFSAFNWWQEMAHHANDEEALELLRLRRRLQHRLREYVLLIMPPWGRRVLNIHLKVVTLKALSYDQLTL